MIERLLQFIDYKKISKLAFYKEVGLSNGFLDKIKSVGTDNLVKILNTYPEINPIWLLLGEGEMIKKDGIEINNSDLNVKNGVVGNNITGNTGNVTISFSNEDVSKIIELHKELNERLKKSQEQTSILLEILSNNNQNK